MLLEKSCGYWFAQYLEGAAGNAWRMADVFADQADDG